MRTRPSDWRRSGNPIGRILIGKLPGGITAHHVHNVCSNVPMPGRNENCWDWTHHAIQDLQAQRWLTNFAWDGANGFEARAYNRALDWQRRDPKMKYYHNWDIFGLDNHCSVM